MKKNKGKVLTLVVRLAALLSIMGFAHGLRNVRLSMPPAVVRNSEIVIVCHYDLEDDHLYTVKWYRGGREFFRYTPMEDPPVKVFPIHGLHLDKNKSNAHQVVLRHVTPAISGRYSCEVSADAPSFHTALVSGDMDVVDPPKTPPSIKGIKARYRVGEILNVTCASQPSRPPANLTWVINDQLADPSYVTHYPPKSVPGKEKWETEEMRRMTSKAGLNFVVHSEHFVESTSGGGRKLKIRCTANVHGLYWKTNEKSVEEERPKLYGVSPQAVEIGEEGIRSGVPYYLGGGRGHYDVVVEEDDSMEMERRGNDVIAEEGGGHRRDMEALDEAGREDGYHGDGRRRHGTKDASSGSLGPPIATLFFTLISLIVSIR
ncbi:uncharacterized protein LOC124157390 [Ischnura elegans]|uniref:uncharacterized protein LOC124157390 n=1 Tax=Ischnura elegans TaxID=197161 RepID=UPI001ED897EE|nr:uncharacterized protein LOC124157390 [Ischnura elegans]